MRIICVEAAQTRLRGWSALAANYPDTRSDPVRLAVDAQVALDHPPGRLRVSHISRLSRSLVSRGVVSPHWPPLETIKASLGVRLCVDFDSIVAISRLGLECYHWHLHLSVHSPQSTLPVHNPHPPPTRLRLCLLCVLDERSESLPRFEFAFYTLSNVSMSDDWTQAFARGQS